ncbi:AraC family transcriptional regulator [Janthinobacterium aquaticum]|uniref:AraC family transcriptional regulator n=1 Tax=Janthinobacterium sp. FT58W TaxID=2654254 RepID=UPI0012657768|nr:helix-turn-helix transcriptional regulator [Janthinobacterium sp. FT58W]KAB8037164.1 helix-turn-helix domain-containing protein [Janthinobacterium sp. FT58W]
MIAKNTPFPYGDFLDDFYLHKTKINAFHSQDKLPSYLDARSHSHVRAELLYCAKGLINVQVGKCLWVVPENCAVWIPSRIAHRSFGSGFVEYCAIFVDIKQAASLPHEAFVIEPTVLLRELILKSVSLKQSYEKNSAECRFFSVLFDEIGHAQRLNLIVPMPTDPRLQLLVEQLIANPADKTSHGEWAARLALSERNFSRIIMQQLGMTLGRWRHQLHITIAIPRIRSGETIQKVAHDLGYENASSFISMFKSIMHNPPNRFVTITRNRKHP